jgi:hypothetical protein
MRIEAVCIARFSFPAVLLLLISFPRPFSKGCKKVGVRAPPWDLAVPPECLRAAAVTTGATAGALVPFFKGLVLPAGIVWAVTAVAAVALL